MDLTGIKIVGTVADRELAISTMLKFLEALHQVFPECEDCRKGVERFKNDVVGIDIAEDLACQQWLTTLTQPLDGSVAKYAYPLQRLLGRPAMLYHAIAYGDGDTMVKFVQIPLVSELKLHTKWHHPEFAEDRHLMLTYIHKITERALAYTHVTGLGPVPDVPSRGELDAEIKRFAAAQQATRPKMGVEQALHATLEAVSGLLTMYSADALPDGPIEAPELDVKLVCDEWDVIMSQPDFAKLCERQNGDAVMAILETSIIPGFDQARRAYQRMDKEVREELFQHLNNAVGFATVGAVLPKGMRAHLEKVAAELTAGFESGEVGQADMNEERMIQLAQSVLENTSMEDVEAMVQNMDKLIPVVKQMSKAHQDTVDLSGMWDMIDASM
jgi:hypothetical protein